MPDQRRLRREHHVLHAIALVVEKHVFHFAELAIRSVAIERLHQQVLTIRVLLARNLELLLLGGEVLDDLVDRDTSGLRRIQRPFAAIGREQRSGEKKEYKCNLGEATMGERVWNTSGVL